MPLEDGKEYHLQGLDGNKFILDHNSRIEEWPSDFNLCVETKKKACLEKTCSRLKNPKRRTTCFESRSNEIACKRHGKDDCADYKNFEKYVKEIENKRSCEEIVCDA